MKQATEIRIPYEKLESWCKKILAESGMDETEVNTVTKVLLSTNLRGVDTHGVNMIPSYASRFKSIEHREIRVIEDKGAGCVIDGGNHTGQMTSVFALEKAMEKADRYGLGLALVKESCHNGA